MRLDTDEGQQYWLGYRNFWSISRYNRSISYTMAVVDLAAAIAE
ncbi:lytic murein transglycosylase [Reinekea blandensis]|nr:lytic murein transglycosylase [Reinekea blandensis]